MPYSVVLLFTVANDCTFCKVIEDAFTAIASSYKAQLKDKSQPIFFAVLYYSRNTEKAFSQATSSLTGSTPSKAFPLLLSAPSLSKSKSTADCRNDLPSMNTWRYTGANYNSEDSLLEYINKRTNQNVALKKSLFAALWKMLVALTVLGCLLFAVIRFRWILSIPVSWLVVAFVVFLVCCGGTVHNILHRTPLMGVTKSKSGQTEYEYISTGVSLSSHSL